MFSRKTSQQIVIGDTIELTVLQVRGGKVRLGISAPPSVRIQREEVHERMELERRRNGSGQPSVTVAAMAAGSIGEPCVLGDA